MTSNKGFKLEQLLRLRAEVEKSRTIALAEARHELDGATAILQSDEKQMDRLSLELDHKQSAGISAMELQMYANFFRKKTMDISLQRGEVERLDRDVAEKRETLLDATKEKKVLESLKEKKKQAHHKELAEKERAFLDELPLLARGKQSK